MFATGVLASVDSLAAALHGSLSLLLFAPLPGRRFKRRLWRDADSKVLGGQRGKSLSRSSCSSTRCLGFSTSTTWRTLSWRSCSVEKLEEDILPLRYPCWSHDATNQKCSEIIMTMSRLIPFKLNVLKTDHNVPLPSPFPNHGMWSVEI